MPKEVKNTLACTQINLSSLLKLMGIFIFCHLRKRKTRSFKMLKKLWKIYSSCNGENKSSARSSTSSFLFFEHCLLQLEAQCSFLINLIKWLNWIQAVVKIQDRRWLTTFGEIPISLKWRSFYQSEWMESTHPDWTLPPEVEVDQITFFCFGCFLFVHLFNPSVWKIKN
jgi:hypothetical protein